MASGLRSLLDGLAAAGLKRPDDVRVCLSAGTMLFRDWAFPFRSRAKVEQALSLLLETEFPFDADTLSHRVCLTGNAAASAGYKSGAQAISVSLRKEERDLWLDAFEAEGLFPRLVTVDPFPLLTNLPSRQNGIALFLHVQRECSAVALLDNGTIRRIRAIPVGWTPETDAAGLNISSSEQENAALRGLADRAAGAKRPSYWKGRLSYRIAFLPMVKPFSETARPPVSPRPSSCPFPCLVKKSP